MCRFGTLVVSGGHKKGIMLYLTNSIRSLACYGPLFEAVVTDPLSSCPYALIEHTQLLACIELCTSVLVNVTTKRSSASCCKEQILHASFSQVQTFTYIVMN